MANHFTDNPSLKFHLNHPLMKKIVALKERNFKDKDEYDYAPRDFEDAMDNYERSLEIIGEICGETIEPNAESVDSEGPKIVNNEVVYAPGTSENYKALVDAGVIGMTMPRKYAGLNFPITPYIVAGEMISRADGGFANIWGLQDCAETIYEFASEEIKEEYLPRFANEGATAAMDLTEPDAGSDLQKVQLKATFDKEKNQWYLNGVKRFITNGDADIALVLARSVEGSKDGRGLSLFVYDRRDKAVIVRRLENKLGIKGSPTAELVFKNAPAKLVGTERMGLIKYVMSLMNAARLGVGGQSVGIAEAAYREAKKYASERIQFEKTIDQFPAVYEMLTDMRIKLQAIRSLLYETSRYVDIYKIYNEIAEDRKLEPEERKEQKYYQRLADVFTPLLKLFSSEYSNQLAYDAIQIHGGAGFMKDFPVERLYRDARITSIYEGTSQLQVVAAIRGVTTKGYLNRIKELDELKNEPEQDHLKKTLREMTADYEKAFEAVNAHGQNEYLDFHARRLVEMAGNIIMGYLLIADSQRDEEYKQSAELFVRKAAAENKQKSSFLMNFDIKDLGQYKVK